MEHLYSDLDRTGSALAAFDFVVGSLHCFSDSDSAYLDNIDSYDPVAYIACITFRWHAYQTLPEVADLVVGF